MKKIMIFMAAVIVLSACSQNTDRERNGESVNIKPAGKTETSASAGMSGARSNMRITKPTELLPEIAEKYSGVNINVINQSDNFISDIIIPFGEKTAIADTDLEILVSSYFTNFTMADGGVINVSMDENNPAAKIVIYKGGEQVFDGWLFQNYPDMHSFEDPVWKILMVRGAAK